jgi:UDP-N-acetylmuramate dehydrogenase
MKILENEDLKKYSYLNIGGVAKYICEIENEEDIKSFIDFSNKEKMPRVILGSGSNTFFNDGLIKKVFGVIKISGKFKSYNGPNFVNVEIGAGENWDELVEWTVQNNWSGLESLSLIPGTAGASPVQNIGAYGQEVKNVITHVRAYDTEYDEFIEIPNDQCLFEYRNSIFKKNPGRFIISSISMQLKKVSDKLPIPQYKDLQLYFLEKKQKTATLLEIRKAVIKIRSEKLPNPKKSPNCGSYFKNPILSNIDAEKILQEFPKIPHFKMEVTKITSSDGNESETNSAIKFFAGWLIEQVDLKGFEYKNLATDEKNALVIINKGESRANDLLEFEKIINEKVERSFGIILEREPIFISQ